MDSNLEPVPVTSQKHDPAWKHCQMFKVGDRVQLKCIYCAKVFKGGGIHRIKEHLAGQKGNASTCLRVQPDVRLLMQESLNGVVVKKRKKQKLAEEISTYNGGDIVEVASLNTEIDLLPMPEALEQASDMFLNGDEGGNKMGGRKKKGRIRKASSRANNGNMLVAMNQAAMSRRVNGHVHMAIARFLLDARVPFDSVNSVYFQPMIDAIASQRGEVAGPTYHELRSWVLKASVQEVRNDVDQCSSTWMRSGCSVLVDEWNTGKGKALVNFFVYCPEGTMFLRSVDASSIIHSPDSLFELLKEVVEEVGVRNVLQVVTNSEDRYVIAGKRLTDAYPTILWTPCAAHCIDLMLEDMKKLEWINTILEQAKSISRFIYNNNYVLNMMRKFTVGVDLVDLGATPSATDFLTLKRMVNIKCNLQLMVTSGEWMETPCSKKPEELAVLDHISNQSFWSACTLITQLTDPILRLLRIVCSEERPAMAYVYAGIYRAKETIKKELANKKDYSVYWNIIDHRWEQLQRHPLHAAGFYLNPKFFYTTEEDLHLHIRSLVYDCIEKLVPDPKIQDKIVKETAAYHNSVGDFGRKMAMRARDTLLPVEWWSTYGGGCPNLARLAIRILSQTSGLIMSRPGRIPLEEMHESRNCIEHQRLNDLAFVQYNFWLRQRYRKNMETDSMDSISYDKLELVHDWVSRTELSSEDMESLDWMTVDPPSGSIAPLSPLIDDIEALGAGFDDYEIFGGHTEEENGEENNVNE